MSKLQSLKAASNLNDVALLLGFKPASLSYILYRQSGDGKYKNFQIPKRFGGTRAISAPVAGLKVAQKKLSNLLQDSVDEINAAAKGRKDQITHGFTRKRSIITNASRHRNRRYVFNIDLKDFFPSINFGRVRGYFMKNKDFSLKEKVVTVLAQIACYENALPQGGPCSPVISNLITHSLDMYCVALAAKVGCVYSPCADDLTFSTNKRIFPAEIALQSGNNPHTWVLGAELLKLVKRAGFAVNPRKTRMQYRDSRQEVTRLTVNEKINVRREYRHTVRAMVHSLVKHGSFDCLVPVKDASGNAAMEQKPGTLNQLHGMLSFIGSVDLHNKKKAEAQSKESQLPGKEATYRKFLMYRDFYAAQGPVVVCEGGTDNVYLIHAIRSLAPSFPDLAHVTPEGKISLRIRLYKHSGSRTARIVDLGDGGSASLTKFIGTYYKEAGKFGAPGHKHPVIILYDNDSGANGIKGIIKQLSTESFSGTEPFIRIVRNLYAVPTPPVAGSQQSKIEDFFEPAIKTTVVDGKTFRDGNKFDETIHYGKNVFAHKVIRPMAETLDFSAFSPLLTNIVAVLKQHAAGN